MKLLVLQKPLKAELLSEYQYLKSKTTDNIHIQKMATSSSFSEDLFLCSICLELFQDPVSTPCGHNFCKACITKYWKDKQHCECPLCKEKFHKVPKLRVNTTFRDVMESFKKHHKEVAEVLVQPGEVPCDYCQENKIKASKTCLSCLVSYCDTHLQPHYRVNSLKTHKLSDPVQNLEDKICNKHNKIFELFCRKEQICICVMCTEHNGHDTAPLQQVYEEKKAELEVKKKKVDRIIWAKQKMVQKLKKRAKREDSEKHWNQPHNVSKENGRGERRPDMIIKELEEEITKFQTSRAELDGLSQIEDHLQLIQRFVSLLSNSEPIIDGSSDVRVRKPLHVNNMEENGNELRTCHSKIQEEETDLLLTPTDKIACQQIAKYIMLMKFLQYHAVDITFDPQTANDQLLFSQDLKQVKTAYIWLLPGGPHRFDRYTYVLGNTGFCAGKFYFEVQVTGKSGWDLGLIRESMKKTKKITPNPETGIWIIRLRKNSKCNSPSRLTAMKKPERVRVFTDYENGLVEFYDADDLTLIHSFTNCEFKDTIFPFFSPGPTECGRNCAPLVLPYLRHSQLWTDTTKISMSECLIIIIVFVFFVLVFVFVSWFQNQIQVKSLPANV
ncbi:E3 ubiquitin-protein ligase TRIM39-like [Thalassophryne amazonica]|uniref:E3 ubiquitin-protein ligase TRIM39-like n=1 Tax=Thalassophryne amazonica TaxID=390379 RepID=UPI0014723941|nr:E3 ubiquitin-protein ligase TRIM39-like [Thalassophryne amazonica]